MNEQTVEVSTRRILRHLLASLSARNSVMAVGGILDSEFERQVLSILTEARDLMYGNIDINDVSVDYREPVSLASTGAIRAMQNVHPAESLMAAEVLFDVALDALSSEYTVSNGPGADLLVARSLHHAIWRRFPPGAIAYAAALRQQLSDVHEEAKTRLSRDLHDRISHAMAAGIQRVELALPIDDESSDLDSVALLAGLEILRDALRDVQNLAGELRARVGEMRISEALLEYVSVSDPGPLSLSVEEVGTPTPLQSWVSDELFTIAVEAIRNSIAHAANASRVGVKLMWSDDEVELLVIDDGDGFDVHLIQANSIGLAAIEERSRTVGAVCDIHSAIGGGTRIQIVMPLIPRVMEPPTTSIGEGLIGFGGSAHRAGRRPRSLP